MENSTINSVAVESAKSTFKASLEAQVASINARIAELKPEITNLEAQKRQVEGILKGLDRKPSEGRVWSPEAKAKLSASLKAAAAKKKLTQGTAGPGATQVSETTQPSAAQPVMEDFKSRAAGDTATQTAGPVDKKRGSR
jgi:peptidoglycan hydrolase CwlO-like protein